MPLLVLYRVRLCQPSYKQQLLAGFAVDVEQSRSVHSELWGRWWHGRKHHGHACSSRRLGTLFIHINECLVNHLGHRQSLSAIYSRQVSNTLKSTKMGTFQIWKIHMYVYSREVSNTLEIYKNIWKIGTFQKSNIDQPLHMCHILHKGMLCEQVWTWTIP